jgi:serine phosphatase RsbU (regulator of sigma subunit)/anti-sigma regulatory factor (Ser/Thr protein kinase)
MTGSQVEVSPHQPAGRDPITNFSGNGKKLRPTTVATIILLAGICMTMVFSWSANNIDQKSEERLLEIQSKQAAAVLATAIFVIEQPLSSALTVQEALGSEGNAEAFRETMGSSIGSDKAFVSASLWRVGPGRPTRIGSAGVSQGMPPDGTRFRQFLDRAKSRSTSVVRLEDVGKQTRVAFALSKAGTDFVIYAERPIPADRRAPVDRESAYKDLTYAIYLGPTTSLRSMTTTNIDPAQLPLKGLTHRASVPFGDTVLTLTTSRREHLGSTLSEQFPLLVLVGGLALTAIATPIGHQLVAARVKSEKDVGTITDLFSRVDGLYEQQRGLFLRLQRALLPQNSPDIPGFEFSSDYVAGADGIDIGGDWYSVISVGDDEFAFVVGDVSGRGIDAVAVMARARFTLRAYLVDGATPQQALEKCSHQFDISIDGHMITAIAGVVNWRTGEVTVANAGHPPPLLVTSDGAEYVSVPVGQPLGCGATTYEARTLVMPEGSSLFSFTDGLVERRTESIDVGLRRLAQTIEPLAESSLDDVVVDVVSSLRDGDESDDIAVLALRRGSAAKVSLAGDVGAPSEAREFISGHLDAAVIPTGVPVADIELAVSELVTNAVEAGATSIEVEIHSRNRRLDAIVSDDAAGWPTLRHADTQDPRGRGLEIVQRLSDTWVVTRQAHGKRITVTWLEKAD